MQPKQLRPTEHLISSSSQAHSQASFRAREPATPAKYSYCPPHNCFSQQLLLTVIALSQQWHYAVTARPISSQRYLFVSHSAHLSPIAAQLVNLKLCLHGKCSYNTPLTFMRGESKEQKATKATHDLVKKIAQDPTR